MNVATAQPEIAWNAGRPHFYAQYDLFEKKLTVWYQPCDLGNHAVMVDDVPLNYSQPYTDAPHIPSDPRTTDDIAHVLHRQFWRIAGPWDLEDSEVWVVALRPVPGMVTVKFGADMLAGVHPTSHPEL